MIKSYYKKDGNKYYLFKLYMGVDPITGKKRYTTRRGFKTQKEAKLAMARLQTEIKDKGITTQNNITFKEVYEMWLEQYENTVKKSTFSIQKDVMRLHVLPKFGNMKLSKISTSFCQKQVNDWYSYYKKYSNLIGLTNSILSFAISLGFISSNPMQNIIRPKKKKNIGEKSYQAPFYNKEQLKQFFEALKDYAKETPQLFIMFRLLAFTGMRKGELLALRWCDVDFINKTITINQTLAKGDNSYFFQTPKTEKSIRTISIDETTFSQLKKWQNYQKEFYLKLGYNTSSKEQLVFTNLENQHLYLDYLNNHLKNLLRKYNLDKITIHGFRHTHCSLLFEAGASIKEVQERLGHTDIKTTMDIYTHVTEQAKNETAQKFSDYVNF